MKKKYIAGLLTLLLMLALVGCDKSGEPVRLPTGTELELEQIFEAGGEVYYLYSDWELRTRTHDYYIMTENMTDGTGYLLDGSCVWGEASERLYLADKRKIYSYDLQGADKTLVWEWKEGKGGDKVVVEGDTEGFLLVRAMHGSRVPFGEYEYNTLEYFSVDLTTGEAKSVISEDGYYKMLDILCAQGDSLFCLQLEDGRYYPGITTEPINKNETVQVIRLDLRTGEKTVLGAFDSTTHPIDQGGHGVVLDDELYFTYDTAYVYHVPLGGGELEILEPQKPEDKSGSLEGLQEWNGKLYSLLSGVLCEWDRENNNLEIVQLEIVQDMDLSDYGFIIADGKCCVYGWPGIHASGELETP